MEAESASSFAFNFKVDDDIGDAHPTTQSTNSVESNASYKRKQVESTATNATSDSSSLMTATIQSPPVNVDAGENNASEDTCDEAPRSKKDRPSPSVSTMVLSLCFVRRLQ